MNIIGVKGFGTPGATNGVTISQLAQSSTTNRRSFNEDAAAVSITTCYCSVHGVPGTTTQRKDLMSAQSPWDLVDHRALPKLGVRGVGIAAWTARGLEVKGYGVIYT